MIAPVGRQPCKSEQCSLVIRRACEDFPEQGARAFAIAQESVRLGKVETGPKEVGVCLDRTLQETRTLLVLLLLQTDRT